MNDEQVLNAEVRFHVAMIQTKFADQDPNHGFIQNIADVCIASQRVDIQKRNIVNNTFTFSGKLSYFQFNYGLGFENAYN